MERGGFEPEAREELEVGEIGFSNLKRLGCLKSKMSGFLKSKMDGQLEAEAKEDMPGLSKLNVEAGDERLGLLAGNNTGFEKSKMAGSQADLAGFPGFKHWTVVESLAKQLMFYCIYFHGCWTNDLVHFHRLFGYVDQLLYRLFWGRVKL